MATVIDQIEGADGRTVELTIEPGTIALVVRSPDHERPERTVLSWDEFDQAMDRLRVWRRLVAPPVPAGPTGPADELDSFVAELAGGPRKPAAIGT